jgi:isocitrate dehydrogenase
LQRPFSPYNRKKLHDYAGDVVNRQQAQRVGGCGMVGVCLFFWFGGRFVIEGVVHGMVSLDGGDKKSGSKSHDHEVQRMSITAAKTAENSVQCPGN